VIRQRGVPLIGLAVLAVLFAACGGTSGPAATEAPSDKLTVGFSNITGDNLAPWVAKVHDLFQKNRLEVDLQSFSGGTSTMSALLSGQLQFAHLGGSEVLSAAANGADVVILANFAPVYPYVLMVQPNIRSTADLRGKRFGVSSPGGSADIATRSLLKREGLDPDKDVTLVPLGSHANRTAALLSGQLDAGVDDPPDTAKLEAKGLRALVDVAALKLPTANTFLAAQRSWVKDHKDIAQRYVDSLVQAIALANKDRSRSVSAMKKYFKSSDEQALGSASDFFTKEVIPALPYPTVEQFADAKTVLGAKNPKVRTYEVATLLDPSFVKSAENRNLHR